MLRPRLPSGILCRATVATLIGICHRRSNHSSGKLATLKSASKLTGLADPSDLVHAFQLELAQGINKGTEQSLVRIMTNCIVLVTRNAFVGVGPIIAQGNTSIFLGAMNGNTWTHVVAAFFAKMDSMRGAL